MFSIRFTALLGLLLAPLVAVAADLEVERLTWAGVRLVQDDTTVLIDAVGTDLWDGAAPEGLVPVVADTRLRYALVTHAHNDHFDVETLKEVLGERGYVICHDSIATYVASRGLRVIPASDYVPVVRGGFVFTAVPAVDGFGSEQVSWVITAGDKRLLHGGDTLWHGNWPTINMQFGPFDAVFLPVNGARVAREPALSSALVMTPPQAVDVAQILRAKWLVPIHYGLDDPPHYTEVDKPLEQTLRIARERGQGVQHLRPGEALQWSD